MVQHGPRRVVVGDTLARPRDSGRASGLGPAVSEALAEGLQASVLGDDQKRVTYDDRMRGSAVAHLHRAGQHAGLGAEEAHVAIARGHHQTSAREDRAEVGKDRAAATFTVGDIERQLRTPDAGTGVGVQTDQLVTVRYEEDVAPGVKNRRIGALVRFPDPTAPLRIEGNDAAGLIARENAVADDDRIAGDIVDVGVGDTVAPARDRRVPQEGGRAAQDAADLAGAIGHDGEAAGDRGCCRP
mmetsp:Transcript_3698/g.6833  ORF Transcript_3698/g.6833 Transcript_3698/m.6833 type:complete len:242 (-) Transcript_3698:1733-2458(-)